VATIAGHNMREKEGATCGGEGGISNIAREGKEGVLVMTGTAVVVAKRTILNSLIKGVIFEEVASSDSRAIVGTPLIRAILIGVLQSMAIYPYPRHRLHLSFVLILKF